MNGSRSKRFQVEAVRQPLLHRAAWVIPVSDRPISDGGVLVHDGWIKAVGPFKNLYKDKPHDCRVKDHGYAALMPGMVNAHTHLEWSFVEHKITFSQSGFAAWLRQLLPHRIGLNEERVRQSWRHGLKRIHESPTVLYADVGSEIFLCQADDNRSPVREVQSSLQAGPEPFQSRPFFEVLGFDIDALEDVVPASLLNFHSYSDLHSAPLALAAHACYSTCAALIQAAKEWDRRRGRVFSIHAAEHVEEVEFIQSGTGFCKDLLVSLGRWDENWRSPKTTPLTYLDRLGVLDDSTLLVHAVHMTDSDWQLVHKRRCCVCFCPRSNMHIGVGKANMDRATSLGIATALGTDSLASNTDLDLFKESCFVLDHFPEIAPEQVLHMATAGGARALKAERFYGTLQPGKSAAFIAVDLPQITSRKELATITLTRGAQGEWRWVTQPQTEPATSGRS